MLLLGYPIYKYPEFSSRFRIRPIFDLVMYLVMVDLNSGLRMYIQDPYGNMWFRNMMVFIYLIVIPMLITVSSENTLILGAISIAIHAGLFYVQGTEGLLRPILGTLLVYMSVCMLVGTGIRWASEQVKRREFLVNIGLIRSNNKLRNKLTDLQQTFAHRVADFDSPLEKVMLTLKSLMANPNMDGDVHQQIEVIMKWLSASESIFMPDFEGALAPSIKLEDEQEAWLQEVLPVQRRSEMLLKKRQSEDILRVTSIRRQYEEHGQTEHPESSISNEPDAESPSLTTPKRSNNPNDEFLASSMDTLDYEGVIADRDKVVELLGQISTWNWPIFEFEALTHSRPLYALSMHLLFVSGLTDRLMIPKSAISKFLFTIECKYRNVTYHNSTHAADVLHAVNFFLNLPYVKNKLTDIELLGSFLAAIIHDVDHPGVNSNFLIATNSHLAMLYNDRSVLENHHVSMGLSVLKLPGCDIFEGFSDIEYRLIREQIIDMVLATDLAGHFAMVSAFKNKVCAAENFSLDNKDDKSLFLRMTIKCSDVCNLTKTWGLYATWTSRLMVEFYKQGDEERRLNLPVSPFMDREGGNMWVGQLSFLDFLCMPMYETFGSLLQIPEVIQHAKDNRARMLQNKDREQGPRQRKASVAFMR
ncbi:uncharacterized protein BJ171DRAFT_100307 [Polychytrium aggregatum]|uniref:uncharacterized protein n=1 Tax=Polychytrium aggregatum TaxID=110093 RepID=UPI0022FF3430|nr:uncharacterized protein BJ171DRAFT_100307 [Polychytrium aggregatum]KAI9204722.1 hypothetical protein BJ171DRAFT_100307 [Polychytrium aggregatum]